MKKLLLLFLWLPSLALASNAKDYYGHWKTTDIADHAHVSAVDDKEAAKKVGEYLILSPHRVSFDGHRCKPEYQLSEVDPAKDLDTGYRISNETLKLPNPVLAIDTGCIYIYALDKNHIVLESDGVFYHAVRHNRSKTKKQ